MPYPKPIHLDRPTIALLARSPAAASSLFGAAHAEAVRKLAGIAARQGSEIDIALLNDGHRQTVVARAPGAHATWAPVRVAHDTRRR